MNIIFPNTNNNINIKLNKNYFDNLDWIFSEEGQRQMKMISQYYSLPNIFQHEINNSPYVSGYNPLNIFDTGIISDLDRRSIFHINNIFNFKPQKKEEKKEIVSPLFYKGVVVGAVYCFNIDNIPSLLFYFFDFYSEVTLNIYKQISSSYFPAIKTSYSLLKIVKDFNGIFSVVGLDVYINKIPNFSNKLPYPYAQNPELVEKFCSNFNHYIKISVAAKEEDYSNIKKKNKDLDIFKASFL